MPVNHPRHARLPADFRIRRAKRLKREGIRRHAVEIARGQVGYIEQPPGSNRTKYNVAYYGANVSASWCAIFVTWCRHKAGDTGFKYSFVPTVMYYAARHMHGLMPVGTSQVVQGDMPAYDWDNDGTPDHLEFFDRWITPGVSFMAIGGNTGSPEGVHQQERFVSDVEMFIRRSMA